MNLKYCIYLIIFFAFLGCTEREKITDHKFALGEIVKVKLDGTKGIVTGRYNYSYRYQVKVPSANGYSTVDMRDYELEKVAATKDSAFVEADKDSVISVLRNELSDAKQFKSQVHSLVEDVENKLGKHGL